MPDNDMRFCIEILLLQFSTGKPHPEAQQQRILVTESPWPRPAIGIEIVGDTLALITNCHHHIHALPFEDEFYIFDWKTGVQKMVRIINTPHSLSSKT